MDETGNRKAAARHKQNSSGKPTAGLDWHGRNGFHRAAARRARMIMHVHASV